MASKYTVKADSKFIGHYHGKTPQEAIQYGMGRYKSLFPNFSADNYSAQKTNGELFEFAAEEL